MFNTPVNANVTSLLSSKGVALLIIDKQNAYFADDSPVVVRRAKHPEMLENLIQRIDDFIVETRKLAVPVVWTRMVEDLTHSPENIRYKMVKDETPPISEPGKNSINFFGEVKPLIDETVITKYFYDAFTNKSMDEFIATHPEVRTFILVGGYTSRCLLGAAFAANARGYHVIVPEDLVGMPDTLLREHEAALDIMGSILGHRIQAKDLLIQLKSTVI